MNKKELWARFAKHGITKKSLHHTGKYSNSSIYSWGRNDHVPKPIIDLLDLMDQIGPEKALAAIPSHKQYRDNTPKLLSPNFDLQRALEIYEYVKQTSSIDETRKHYGFKNENSVREILKSLEVRGYPRPRLITRYMIREANRYLDLL